MVDIAILKARHKQVILKNIRGAKITVELDLSEPAKVMDQVTSALAENVIQIITKSKPVTAVHYVMPFHLDQYFGVYGGEGIQTLIRSSAWKKFEKEVLHKNGFNVQWFDNLRDYKKLQVTTFAFNAREDNGYWTGVNYNNISIFEKAPKSKHVPRPPSDDDYGYSW